VRVAVEPPRSHVGVNFSCDESTTWQEATAWTTHSTELTWIYFEPIYGRDRTLTYSRSF
jgi:hypothetical protein